MNLGLGYGAQSHDGGGGGGGVLGLGSIFVGYLARPPAS